METPKFRNIILIGFMGTGKTVVGRALAERLRWKFMDTDRLIEERAGKSIPEIFAESGEEAFRKMEGEIARELPTMRHCVIATGGGFPLREENRRAAMDAGRVILLVASPEEIWHRIGQSRHRPLLQVENPMDRIRQLLAERSAAYDAIPTRISTDRRAPEALAAEILELLGSE